MKVIDHGPDPGPGGVAYVLLAEVARDLRRRDTELVCEVFLNPYDQLYKLVVVDHELLLSEYKTFYDELCADEDGLISPRLCLTVDSEVIIYMDYEEPVRLRLCDPGSLERLYVMVDKCMARLSKDFESRPTAGTCFGD